MMKSLKDPNSAPNLKQSFHSMGHRFTNQRESIWQLFNNAPNGYTIPDAADVLKKKRNRSCNRLSDGQNAPETGPPALGAWKKRRASVCCPSWVAFSYADLPRLRPGGRVWILQFKASGKTAGAWDGLPDRRSRAWITRALSTMPTEELIDGTTILSL